MPELTLHQIARPDELRIFDRATPHDLDGVAYRRKRVAQFMRKNGQKLILVAVGFLESRLGAATHYDFTLQCLVRLFKLGIGLPQVKIQALQFARLFRLERGVFERQTRVRLGEADVENLQLAPFEVQLDQHRDFATQYFRNNGHVDVINRAKLVAL